MFDRFGLANLPSAPPALPSAVPRGPVPLDGDAAAILADQPVPGGKLANAGEERQWRRHVGECEVLANGLKVQVSRNVGILQEGLDLGGKQQPPIDDRVVERLLSQAIS